MRHGKKLTGFTAVMAIMLLICMPASTGESRDTDSESRIIVSLGDSYSAGEGIPPFYDQTLPVQEKVKSADWAAHRSKNAWSGMLKLSGVGKMSGHRNGNWFFAAATGAETKHLNSTQRITYNRGLDGFTIVKGRKLLLPQLDVFDELNKKGLKADYVTMTIGGNDVDFAGIVKSAVIRPPYVNPNWVTDKVEDTWNRFSESGGVEESLLQAYRDVARSAGDQAEIIVAGYPRLLSPFGSRFFFDVNEARYLNEQTTRFNNEIQRLVEKCAAEGVHIHFISVEEEFIGHGAYADDPYINPVMMQQAEDHDILNPVSAYSIHPNKEGAKAYAGCVQAEIDRLEKLKKEKNAKQTEEPGTPELPVSGTAYPPENQSAGMEFQYEKWHCRLLADGTVEIYDANIYYDDRNGVIIPDEVVNYVTHERFKVTVIGQAAFKNAYVSSIKIPESVTTIKGEAFFGAGYPPDSEYCFLFVTIPDSVVYIADDAFDRTNPEVTVRTHQDTFAYGYCKRLGIPCDTRGW